MKNAWLVLLLLLVAAPALATEAADGAEGDLPVKKETVVVQETKDLRDRFTGEPATTLPTRAPPLAASPTNRSSNFAIAWNSTPIQLRFTRP